jgi:hypothetical protein
MLSPTIREELGRLRQIELAREAERRGRLTSIPQATIPRRATSAFVALLRRRLALPTGPRPHDSGASASSRSFRHAFSASRERASATERGWRGARHSAR